MVKRLTDIRIVSIILALLFAASSAFAQQAPAFIEQEFSKNSVYVGEQTLYTFNLNTQTTVFNYQPPEFSLNDAWSEVIAVNQHIRRPIEGKIWDTYSTRRAVYPLTAGTVQLPDLNLSVGVRMRTQRRGPIPFDFGDAFESEFIEDFFAEVTPKTIALKADALTLTVNPLPPAPADFNGDEYIPVGATHLTAHTTRDTLKAGESLTLEITVVSVGNLNPLNTIALSLPTGIRVYPEAPKITQNENNDALIMRKTFRYSLVPIAGGEYEIAPVSVGYFDVETKSYRRASSPAFNFSVEGAAAAIPTPTTSTVPTQTSSEITPQRAAPVPTDAPTMLDRISENVDPETACFIAVALLVLSLIIFTAVHLSKRSRPFRTLRKQCAACQTLEQLGQLFRRALVKFAALSESQYSYEEMSVLLKKREFSAEVEFLTLSLLDQFERRAYSGEATDESTLERLKVETINVISAIMTESGKRRKNGDS